MHLRRVTLLGAALLCSGGLCSAQSAPAYQVIVNQDNPAATLSAPQLSDIFLKKVVRWPSGAAVEPVDLSGDPEVREAFSRQVHQRTTANVKSFWNQEVFSGRGVPPPELATSRDVVQYVAAHSGAIGYVSAGAALEGVRSVGVLVPPRVTRRVEPAYPSSAISARASGDVVLSVEVDKDGSVSRATVVKDQPFGLSREAARAVEQWRFDPATLNGKPVAQSVEITIHFVPPRE